MSEWKLKSESSLERVFMEVDRHGKEMGNYRVEPVNLPHIEVWKQPVWPKYAVALAAGAAIASGVVEAIHHLF